METEGDRLADFLEQTAHVGLDGIEALDFLVVIHEHVRVDLVDEDLVANVVLDLARALYYVVQLLTGTLVVCVVRVDHVDQGTALLDVGN